MISITDGQCGLCVHFGESAAPALTQIRVRGEAPEEQLEACSHPRHADLHLQVTPNSSCDGFQPAKAA